MSDLSTTHGLTGQASQVADRVAAGTTACSSAGRAPLTRAVHPLEIDLEIEEAVSWISACQQETSSIAKALRIGGYIIDHFYRDLDETRSRAPRKSASLRTLQKRLTAGSQTVSAVTLGNYIRVAAQERQLEEINRREVLSRLSLSHRLLLTRIDDIQTKIALAHRAVTESLTCKQLEEVVARAVGNPAQQSSKMTALRSLVLQMRELTSRLPDGGELAKASGSEIHGSLCRASQELQGRLDNLIQALAPDERSPESSESTGHTRNRNCKDIFAKVDPDSDTEAERFACPVRRI